MQTVASIDQVRSGDAVYHEGPSPVRDRGPVRSAVGPGGNADHRPCLLVRHKINAAWPLRETQKYHRASGVSLTDQEVNVNERTQKGPRTTYTVAGIKKRSAEPLIALLQERLNALNDLVLTLKHVHWNVVGPNFISVHTMLDRQADAVRVMVDEAVERIATLCGSSCGTPGSLVAQHSWDDYSISRPIRVK